MKELWKDIVGYEGIYQISNLGNVRSLNRVVIRGKVKQKRKGKVLSNYKIGKGYYAVRLCKKMYPIHRLVALHFLKNKDNKPCVNHIDGNKLNNSASNLEWCTLKENTEHAYKNNLMKPRLGETNGSSKLSEKEVKHIRKIWKSNLYSKTYIAALFNVSIVTVSNIIKNKSWRHV